MFLIFDFYLEFGLLSYIIMPVRSRLYYLREIQMNRISVTMLIILFGSLIVAGCKEEISDPFYKKAAEYEKIKYEESSKAIFAGKDSAEKSAEISREAAKAAGFSSEEEAGKQLMEYIDSEDKEKVKIGEAVIDLAMEYNKKLDQDRKTYKQNLKKSQRTQ